MSAGRGSEENVHPLGMIIATFLLIHMRLRTHNPFLPRCGRMAKLTGIRLSAVGTALRRRPRVVSGAGFGARGAGRPTDRQLCHAPLRCSTAASSRAGAVGWLQVACQRGCRLAGAFTIVELLAVITIIAILASSLAYAVTKARAMARQTDCKSNLRQFGAAILVYRSDHGGRNPAWLSSLYPDYVDDKHLFVCRSDEARGVGRTRPVGLTVQDSPTQNFPETVDNRSHPARTTVGGSYPNGASVAANTAIDACSYFYEFSAAYCNPSWTCTDLDGDGKKSWWEYKEYQLANGDAASGNQPYSTSRMPIIRCYHHWNEGRVRGHPDDGGTPTAGVNKSVIQNFAITLNVAYAGNVYVGPLWWEGALQPGE